MIDEREGAPVRRDAVPRVQAPGGRRGTWTKARKGMFLDQLAATCDVVGAERAAGVPAGSAYRLRRRDPAFAAEWGEALRAGYELLELRLIGRAMSGGRASKTGPIDIDLALKLIGARRDGAPGKPAKAGTATKAATAAETNAALMKRLRVVETRRTIRGEPPLGLPAIGGVSEKTSAAGMVEQ